MDKQTTRQLQHRIHEVQEQAYIHSLSGLEALAVVLSFIDALLWMPDDLPS